MRDFKQTLKKVGGAALFLAILALLLGVLSRGRDGPCDEKRRSGAGQEQKHGKNPAGGRTNH